MDERMAAMKSDVDRLREHNLYCRKQQSDKSLNTVQKELWHAKRDYSLLQAHHEGVKSNIEVDRKNRDGKIILLFRTINKLNEDKYN